MATDKLMLEEIKRKLPIDDLIRRVGGADLHGNGTVLSGWHKAHESTSKNSLHVDTRKGVYHCFGCGQGGDIFTWLGHIRFNGSYNDQNATMFTEVLTEAAELAGVDLPTVDKKALAERRGIEGIFSLAADFYHAALPSDQRAWLHSRYGLTDETINTLKLGFAPAGKTALFAHLHNKLGIIVDDLLKTGLFVKHDSGIQDHFQGRLIFPYWSGARVVYFIGRETDLSPQWEKERGGMKYKKMLVHNDKHPYVSEQVRNHYFYGEDVARGADTLFVTEGVTDCIIANQYGFPCISPVTVRFRKADWPALLELTKTAKTLYIANDNEANDAGGQGALDTAAMLWRHGQMARLVSLPRPDDVSKVDLNDYLREQGPDAFQQVLAKAKTLLDLKIEAVKGAGNENDKIAARKEVFALIAQVDDVYLLEHWRSTLPARLGLSKHSYDNLLKNTSGAGDTSIPKPDPVKTTNVLLNAGVSDKGNAECVLAHHGNIFLHSETLGWLYYDGRKWETSEAEAYVERAITATLEERVKAAVATGNLQAYSALIKFCVPNSGRIQGCKHLLKGLVSISYAAFDNDPDLLNCRNGVVDLRTGKLIPHSCEQRFTYCVTVDYDPDADYTLWEEWLIETLGGTFETYRYMQLAVGYSLTGHTSEEILFYLYGPPRSGKGTFTETMLILMGAPVAKEVDFGTFTAKRTGDSQNFDLAPLRPCRFVAASESNAYERFNEAKVKALTGGNEVYCAFKHRDHFSYRPSFKIWLSSNQPVNADPDDDAVWGRIRVIEFPHSQLGKEDKSLKQRMRADEMLKGVLAWSVAGSVAWYQLGQKGLPEIDQSRLVKDSHRNELDAIQSFIDECCVIGSAYFIAQDRLYPVYEQWCKNSGIEPKKSKGLTQSLKKKGFVDGKRYENGVQKRGIIGVGLRKTD